MAGAARHLIGRFFDVLFAKALTAGEIGAVRSRLRPDLAVLFFQQQDADQRHAFHAAAIVTGAGQEEDVIVAALMHDVGKRHASLGVVNRSIATLLSLFRLPMTSRMRAYIAHGEIAASELEELGAPDLAVTFARHHQGERPPSIDQAVWNTLKAADQPPKARG